MVDFSGTITWLAFPGVVRTCKAREEALKRHKSLETTKWWVVCWGRRLTAINRDFVLILDNLCFSRGFESGPCFPASLPGWLGLKRFRRGRRFPPTSRSRKCIFFFQQWIGLHCCQSYMYVLAICICLSLIWNQCLDQVCGNSRFRGHYCLVLMETSQIGNSNDSNVGMHSA